MNDWNLIISMTSVGVILGLLESHVRDWLRTRRNLYNARQTASRFESEMKRRREHAEARSISGHVYYNAVTGLFVEVPESRVPEFVQLHDANHANDTSRE